MPLGERDPAVQPRIIRELLERRPVRGEDVLRVSRQRDPAERTLAHAEQGPDVGRDEARVREGARVVEAALLRLATQVVAVVEEHGAALAHRQQRLDVPRHRLAGAPHVLRGPAGPQLSRLLERDPCRHVSGERIVR